MTKFDFKFNPSLDLIFERVVDVPPNLVWKAWTTPEHLKQWFTPAPWKTIDAEVDLKPGGIFRTMMQSPDGQNFPNLGCYLEVVKNEKLVWTDSLLPGFRPSPNSFFTAIILLELHGKGTKYTAIAMHKDEEGKKKHEEMGFAEGWGKALDQLVVLMKRNQS
jgi:uncharacterized protein YndB with AHSA1/START domain